MIATCIATGLFSCSESGDDDEGPGDARGGAPGTGVVSCREDPRLDGTSVGARKLGANAALAFELIELVPAPLVKGSNRVVVRVSDPVGLALRGKLGLTLTMPDHGHSASSLPEAVFDEGAGVYTLEPLTLFMAGVWRLDLELTPDDDSPGDSVAYFFCVEG